MQPYSLKSAIYIRLRPTFYKTDGASGSSHCDAGLVAGLTYQLMTSEPDDMGISLNLLTHFTPEPS